MFSVNEAVERVLAAYAAEPDGGQHHEFGWLFWEDCTTQQLVVGDRVDSPDTDSVCLYPAAVRMEIITQHCKKRQRAFVGEFHAHPKGKGTWAGQLPSPHDVVNAGISVAGSMWPLEPPIKGVDSIDISPRFQIIQSLLYGDLIVIERGAAWTPFACLQDQKRELDQILSKYTQWHRRAHNRLGCISQGDHASFYGQWSSEVEAIGCILGARVKVTARQGDARIS